MAGVEKHVSLPPCFPLVLSALVMKLLAKTAEERYQSGYGIKADLEACLGQLCGGEIATLILGQKDLLARFEIPQKLYGREAEVATLMAAFDRVANPPQPPLAKGGLGGVELMLVAGYSGIGKTSVVNEVHKPIVRQRGYFIAGKFDQFKRNIPYASLIQAFRELIQQILTESEAQIQAWQQKLLAALGASGQVIVEVIPELEAIVGKQPTVLPLPPNEAQNRFNLAFKNFIHVFTQKEHPLVMFLDDLQWADSASLNLIEVLITDPKGEYLLIVGAYRDNIDNSYKIPVAYGAEVDAVNFQEVVVSYKFLHDRVQQAAYSLIAEEDKKETHLKIGQLLLKNTNPEELEDQIFDIVNQLNAGIELIAKQTEKTELANLNLIAGRKAKASTAYKTAVKHLNLGIELLPSDRWSSYYDMTFSLYRECAECEYLNGNFERSKELFNDALLSSNSEFDKADIYAIEMNLSMTQGEDFKAGIQAGLDGLRILGLDIPHNPEELQALVEAEFQTIQSNLATINIAELFDRPDLEDRAQNLIMVLLVDLWALAYLDANGYLLNFTVVKIVSRSLEYGNTSLSAFGYVTYGMTIAGSGNYRDAYELGKLALRLNEKFNKTNLIGKVNNLFCHSINPYKQHFKTNIPFYKESYPRCMECGDLTYGVWALFFTIWTQFEVEENLQTVAEEAEKYLGAVQQIGDRNMLYSFLALQRGVWNLQGKTERKYTLNDEVFDEAQFLEMCGANNFDHGINWYSYLKAQLLYLYGYYTDAFNICREAESKVGTNVGFFPVTKYYFYYSLILTEIYPTAAEAEKIVYWETLQKNQEQIKIWADNCPENFLNQYFLVSAEIARISDRPLEAIDFYEQAIESAKRNQFIQNEALANELAAKFWLSQGKEKYAKLHMNAAYYSYQRWGAKRKVEDLEEKYSPWLDRISRESHAGDTSISTSTSNSSGMLDLATVMKASQAISGEILLDKLLSKLMKLAIENAGAQQGFLLLSNDGQMIIEAAEEVDGEVQLLQSLPLDRTQNFPVTIIKYVERTKANMEPADEVGGDYYDVLYTDGVVTIGIGDVTGHGLESGILMVMTQASVRTLQEIKEIDPVRFLDTLNRTIYKNVQRMKCDKNLTLAILNYAEGKLSISGQHEETIVVRKDSKIERIDTIDLGFPIGLDGEIADLISHELVELEPGDGVVLYTDGIPEARDINGKFYGLERLCEVVSINWHLNAQQIKQAAIDDLRVFIGEQKVFDDITLVVLKRADEEMAQSSERSLAVDRAGVSSLQF